MLSPNIWTIGTLPLSKQLMRRRIAAHKVNNDGSVARAQQWKQPSNPLREMVLRKIISKLTPEHWEILKDNVKFFVQVGCAITVFQTYVAELTVCVGPSMLPTFNNRGDVVIFERISTRNNSIARGDVVVSRSPTNPVQLICKRVVALEGDSVITNQSAMFGCSRSLVPTGHVWLAGDNTANSTDSRMYGPVPYGLIQGRVWLKVWPPREVGFVKNALEPLLLEEDFIASDVQVERISSQ